MQFVISVPQAQEKEVKKVEEEKIVPQEPVKKFVQKIEEPEVQKEVTSLDQPVKSTSENIFESAADIDKKLEKQAYQVMA